MNRTDITGTHKEKEKSSKKEASSAEFVGERGLG
jgi:hypothetical protein